LSRDIVQISTCVALDNDGNESSHTMALCNDGTLWMLYFAQKKWQWQPLPDVPQAGVS